LLWKLEPHESGKPHVHFLMLFRRAVDVPRLVAEFRPWNDEAWADVCGVDEAGEPYCGGSACQVKLIRGWKGAGLYCAKYASKSVLGKGRMWGRRRKEFWPVSLEMERCPVPVAVRFRRHLQRCVERRSRALLLCLGAKRDDGRPVWINVSTPAAAERYASILQVFKARGPTLVHFRRMGYRVKRVCTRTRWSVEDPVWGQEEGLGGGVVLCGFERGCRNRGAYPVGADDARRLLELAYSEWLESLEFGGSE
jgi:hypothetical protein